MKSTSSSKPAEDQPGRGGAEPSRFEVLEQLEKIAISEHFRNSKRYPALLRFIVEHTLSGRTDVLKERTLGSEVFGRPSDYDTNADPVVRVAAGEIRKRLAQYYRTPGHERELIIDIPLGSYVPHFLPASPAPAITALRAEVSNHERRPLQTLRKNWEGQERLSPEWRRFPWGPRAHIFYGLSARRPGWYCSRS